MRRPYRRAMRSGCRRPWRSCTAAAAGGAEAEVREVNPYMEVAASIMGVRTRRAQCAVMEVRHPAARPALAPSPATSPSRCKKKVMLLGIRPYSFYHLHFGAYGCRCLILSTLAVQYSMHILLQILVQFRPHVVCGLDWRRPKFRATRVRL